jgi:hypothetical protein
MINQRQIYFSGTTIYQRDSSDLAGSSWPASWIRTPYTTAWGAHGNPPPTDRIDAVAIHNRYNTSGGRIGMRQVFLSRDTYWWRDSTDVGGTQWATS